MEAVQAPVVAGARRAIGRTLTGAAAAAALLTAGCSGPGSDYFPLEGGLTWQYRISFKTMDGLKEKRYVVDALGPEQMGSRMVYPKRALDGSLLLFVRKDSGIFRVGRKPRSRRDVIADEPPMTVLPLPIDSQTSWRATSYTQALERTGPPQETLYRISAPVKMSYEVQSTDDTVEVPAGTFRDCLRVNGTGEVNIDAGNYIGRVTIRVTHTDWYAPGVGLVKSVREEHTGAAALAYGSSTMELQAFNGDTWF
ncbi:MAG: hypothetical protein KJO38_02860 [Gammaproteobacteria bacterium]|nr:hypothetical protein [Gammaproteobacteria bacterium]